MITESDLFVILLCFIIGTGFLILGIAVRAGIIKRWWLMKSTPITPISFAYIAIPTALLLFVIPVLIVFISNPTVRGTVFVYLICPILITIIALTLWQPRWLKPKWLRWLEDNHNALLPLLREDAKRMGARKWEKRVNTQEGLENWVEEVRRKNKFDHLDQRFIGNPHAT